MTKIGSQDAPVLEGRVAIGVGTNDDNPSLLMCQPHEVLIAAGADENGNIASIRIRPDGTVLVNEKVVGSDEEVFDGLKRAIYALLRCDCELYHCSECSYSSYYPGNNKWPDLSMSCPRCGSSLKIEE